MSRPYLVKISSKEEAVAASHINQRLRKLYDEVCSHQSCFEELWSSFSSCSEAGRVRSRGLELTRDDFVYADNKIARK